MGRYAKGTLLELCVMRVPIYASTQPSAERESVKIATVIMYTDDDRIVLRIDGAQPGRSTFSGSLSSTITNYAPRPVKYEVLSHKVIGAPKGATPGARQKQMSYRVVYLQHGTPEAFLERDSLDEALVDLRRIKRMGRTAWVETGDGTFVPVKGAMRKPATAQKNARRRTRRNASSHQFHATPYDTSARGFYFHTLAEFEDKYKKHLPVEEYELQWIDGPEDDRELFEALDVNQATLEQYLDLIDELNEHDKAALYFLLRHRGMGPKEDLDDLLKMVEDEARVMEGSSKDYVYELIDDIGMDGIGENNMQQYFDYERFGRDIAMDMDADDEGDAHYLDMSDQERGEEYVDSMGGVGELGKMAQDYFDVDAFARDMELNGELHEFDFAGKTYTTTFMG